MNEMRQMLSQPSSVRKNPCEISTLNKFIQKREKKDVTFIVESKKILAHGCILAALSEKYEGQFYGPLRNDEVHVTDVSAAAFEEFLQFFYTDEVTLTLENIGGVFDLAKQSMVDELVTECTNFLIEVIGMDKVLWCYRLAVRYQCNQLEEFCVKTIGDNIKTFFRSQDFLSCEQEMLDHILDLLAIKCTAKDVFDGYIAWAQARCTRVGIDAANTANLRTALGASFSNVRFDLMSHGQFYAIGQDFPGLLTEPETIEMYLSIARNLRIE